jgi:hypothetical protein
MGKPSPPAGLPFADSIPMMRPMRLQDILFGILGAALIALMAFHAGVIVPALVRAFACGSIYVFAGMLPSRDEPLGHRLFVTVFLSVVMSSIVLILPGTLGAQTLHPEIKKAVIATAVVLPLAEACFEIVRTPRIIRGILWCPGYR